MKPETDQIIARAVIRCINTIQSSNQTGRLFIRLEDFSALVYRQILQFIKRYPNIIARTIEPIPGFESFAIEDGRSATWYRNHLESGKTLLLIFNRRTSDAQSLKDIYTINNATLIREQLEDLIEASIQHYQYNEVEKEILVAFVGKTLKTIGVEPQLHDLVGFFVEIDLLLSDNNDIETAIAISLPHLGLFRCRRLAKSLFDHRSRSLLREIYRAARIGLEIIDENQQEKLLDNLAAAEFSNESEVKGLSGAEKRQLLRDFINGALANQPEQLKRVLEIDWEEVQQIIKPRRRAATKEQVIQELREVNQELSSPIEEIDMLIDAIERDVDPGTPLIEAVLQVVHAQLSPEVRAALRRLMRPRDTKNADFLYGLMTLLVEMYHLYGQDRSAKLRVSVQFKPTDKRSKKTSLFEAARAFQCVYGGIEQFMPTIHWDLDQLWKIVADRQAIEDEEDAEEQERKVHLQFSVTLEPMDRQARPLAKADLYWEYRADSPVAATALALESELSQTQQTLLGPIFDTGLTALRIPVYSSYQNIDKIDDLDLYQPFRTLGRWFQNAGNLRDMLQDICREKGVRKDIVDPILESLSKLEQAWAAFIHAAQSGLFNERVALLLEQYKEFLHTALSSLTKSQYLPLYRIINRAWMISPSSPDSWVVMPLIQPLKLAWWHNRARAFNNLVMRMFGSDEAEHVHVIDHKILQREIGAAYSSHHIPPALSVADRGLQGQWFTAYEEVQGYELFRLYIDPSEMAGFNIAELAEDEQDIAQSQAVNVLVSVVQDYLATYPFARDGLTIVFLECKHSALPIMMLEKLDQISRKAPLLQQLHVTVHTSRHGATIYRRIDQWLNGEMARTEREGAGYLPRITVDVIECSLQDVIRQVAPADLVLLVDFFTHNSRRLKAKLEQYQEETQESIIHAHQIKPEPFEEGEAFRRLRLTSTAKPDILRLFLLCQYAGTLSAGEKLPTVDQNINLYSDLSLERWQDLIEQLHNHFNWVVCYDETIDRFLLRAAAQDKIQVIRYALGLGVQRLHHLTISSAGRAQEIVEQRLASRLEQMLPTFSRDQCRQIAGHLANRANQVSGDIVLRAAGPGVFLNELIGLVAAIFETEQVFRQQYPDGLPVWILLDDFKHWFNQEKVPDLLFIGLRQDDNQLNVTLQIIEAKCVNVDAVEPEARDARLQVRSGISKLVRAFAPGGSHLDAPYWYDQLYRAIAGNVSLTDRTRALWEGICDDLYAGNFALNASGHSMVFCYDGQAGIVNGPEVKEFPERFAETPEVPLYEHRYGRKELVTVLRNLIQQTSSIDEKRTFDWNMDDGDKKDPLPTTDPLSPPPNTLPEPRLVASSNDNESSEDKEIPGPLPPVDPAWLQQKAAEIEYALRIRNFQFYPINIADADQGPSIIRFKFRPKPNQQLSKIQAQAQDLARELRLKYPPFIDNVPGTHFIGIDIPREPRATVYLRPLLDRLPEPGPAELPVIVGMSPDGRLITEDLSEFPHLLVAGATNSGKSVFLRNLLLSLLSVYQPGQLELLIIDPKQTDFIIFDQIPHLRGGKVIVDINSARKALLDLARSEMPRRQRIIANRSMKIKTFNQRYPDEALPPIVAIIDEYALLKNQMDRKEQEIFEQQLSILAAAARSVGIHLVVATQRPSADVLTSTIKANLDVRVALRVASIVDSRVVLDAQGAENLLGYGDMLFRGSDGRIVRLQAPYIDEDEISEWLKDRFGER